MSASGIVSYSAQLLPFIFANNKLVEVRYTDGGIEFKGNAYINQLKTSGRRGSIETYSVEFRGTGLLTSQFTDLKNSITTNLPFKWSTTSHYFGTIRVDNVRGIIFDKPISVNIPNLIPDVPNYPIDTKPYGDGMAIFDFVVEDHPISLPYSGVLNVVSTTNGLIVHYGTF